VSRRRAAAGPVAEAAPRRRAAERRGASLKEVAAPREEPAGGAVARVQSLGRAFGMLEAIARRPEGMSLVELAREASLHNSTAFHLVRTMVALGYVRQDADSKRYTIGRQLFALAAGAHDEANLVFAAGPILKDLARVTGEACHIALRVGDEVVTVSKSEGPSAIRMAERVGAVRPAYCTAIGKALLAAQPSSQIAEYLARVPLRRLTPNTIVERAALLRELEGVRAAGYAVDDAEFNAEARCIAAPVRDFTGHVVATMGISGPVWRVTIESVPRLARVVVEHADRLSRELGYRTRILSSADAPRSRRA
jgi:DNA-binding IclR family transcriptional regulator